VLSFARYLLAGLIAIVSASAIAQTEFEKIEVGTVLTKAGIKLGVFVKPIPLPDGEWQVVSKQLEEIPLKRGNGAPMAPAKKIWLTLKNNQASSSPIFAIVMGFTPEAFDINWGNSKCANSNADALVDDFGLSPDTTTFVCGTTWSLSGYKKRMGKMADSKNKWVRDNLAPLAAHLDDIADQVLEVNLYGNQYRGRNVGFTFLVKREGDVKTDPSYEKYARDWAHAAGLSLISILKNDATSFALPTPFVTQAAQ